MQDLSHYAVRNLSQLFHAFAGSNFHIDMHVKGRFPGPLWMNFRKTSEEGGGEGVSFPIQKILLRLFLRGKNDEFSVG